MEANMATGAAQEAARIPRVGIGLGVIGLVVLGALGALAAKVGQGRKTAG